MPVIGPPVPGPPQWIAERNWSPREMTPSETRKPAASSTSLPGVRIVTASDRPPTRISSGSSTASVSERRTGSAPTVSLVTGRRTVIRPMPSAYARGCGRAPVDVRGSEGRWIAVMLRLEYRHSPFRLDDVPPTGGRDPFDRAEASLDVSHHPPTVVFDDVMPFAERIQVLEPGLSPVLPCDAMVDFAAGCRHPACGTHTAIGSPLHQPAQAWRRRISMPSDGEDHPGLGMGEDPHPPLRSPGQFAGAPDRDRPDSLHHCRLGAVLRRIEQREDGYSHRDGRTD